MMESITCDNCGHPKIVVKGYNGPYCRCGVCKVRDQ